MRAVDTNVLVRLVTHDEPAQGVRAMRFFENHDVFIPKTALLELEWVLRYSYLLDAAAIADAMLALLDTKRVTAEDERTVREAIALFNGGMDFADALHLTSATTCSDLATFDKAFINKAKKIAQRRVTAP